jgi:hypothetical protein
MIRILLLLAAGVAAASQAPPYAHVATLPAIVDGQPLRSFAFDPVLQRFYAGSDRGLFWTDLAEPSPRMKGPLVREDIQVIEMAPDLGRVFFIAADGIYVYDVRVPGAAKRIARRDQAWDLAYEPSRQQVYVAEGRAPRIRVIDARTGEAGADITVPGWWAQDLEAVPGRIFLTVGGRQGLYAIDAATHRLTPWRLSQRFTTPARAEADPAGQYLFLANPHEFAAVDAETGRIIGRVSTPFPASLAFDPASSQLIATWNNDPPPNSIVVYEVTPTALTEVTRLRNPNIGLTGVESIGHGFVQRGVRSLLLWNRTIGQSDYRVIGLSSIGLSDYRESIYRTIERRHSR